MDTAAKFPINTESIMQEDIVNFPFPYKLWLVVHSERCNFLQWNREGTIIFLDLSGLEIYLNSTISIFKSETRGSFLNYLKEFQFERLPSQSEDGEDGIWLQFKHKNFQRLRRDLLVYIRRANELPKPEFPSEEASNNNKIVEHMKGDLCFSIQGSCADIEKSRILFQTILDFENAQCKLVEQKLDANIATSFVSVNPLNSVLQLEAKFKPGYAGYYGQHSEDTVNRFFGNFLPKFEDVGKKKTSQVGTINEDPSSVDSFTYSPLTNKLDANMVSAETDFNKFNDDFDNSNITLQTNDSGNYEDLSQEYAAADSLVNAGKYAQDLRETFGHLQTSLKLLYDF